jgi:hypothetical protein
MQIYIERLKNRTRLNVEGPFAQNEGKLKRINKKITLFTVG